MQPESRAGTVRLWEFLLVGVILAALAFFLGQWALEGVIHSRKTETVPDLKGRSLEAALDALSPLNLGLKKESVEFDASVPIDSVVRQEPAPGTVVREGKIIKVVVSQGGQTVLTPGLVGLPLRNAQMMLTEGQLALGQVTEAYSLKQDKGVVLSQDPKPDASVAQNSSVNVVVSGGQPPAGVNLMPDFERQNIASAQSWSASSGFQISVKKDPSSLFPGGVILSQDPPPDSVLSQDSQIGFVVSGRPMNDAAQAPGGKMFHYELAEGGAESLVRIVVVDKYGEREIFNGLRKPGSKLDIPLQEAGQARVKIYLNGILVEERDL